jgi:rod shape-determining protein MreD
MNKYLFFILSFFFFYFLALLETSFFIHFSFFTFLPSLLFICQIILVLLEDPDRNLSMLSAFWAGFFWDIFSSRIFGVGILLMISLTLILKLILGKYVHIPSIRKF